MSRRFLAVFVVAGLLPLSGCGEESPPDERRSLEQLRPAIDTFLQRRRGGAEQELAARLVDVERRIEALTGRVAAAPEPSRGTLGERLAACAAATASVRIELGRLTGATDRWEGLRDEIDQRLSATVAELVAIEDLLQG